MIYGVTVTGLVLVFFGVECTNLSSDYPPSYTDRASSFASSFHSVSLNDTTTLPFNETANANCRLDSPPPEAFTVTECVFLSLILGILISVMIIGNILVILAILMEKDLQRPQYYLVCSLAVADLMVGIVVSPLAALYDVNRQWHLGVPMCDFWILSDVLACTASILHLVAIALDRYWSITDVAYMQKRTASRIGYMIIVVWTIACGVSVAPILGWKDSQFHCRVEVKYECLISQDPSYQIFSTTTAFYGPLVLICILYWKIYKAAKKRIQMQVKRRSNANVATIRAKILANAQKVQEGAQDAPSSGGERYTGENDGVCKLDNGHWPQVADGDQRKRNGSYHQNQTGVEIRLIQPSSAEVTGAETDGPSKLHGRNVSSSGSVANSIQQLGSIEDEYKEDVITTHNPKDPPRSMTTAASMALIAEKCNGIALMRRRSLMDGGSIVMGPGGSVDLSTDDDAEYMDGCPPPNTLVNDDDNRRDSLSPPHRHGHRRSSDHGNRRSSDHVNRRPSDLRSSFKDLSPNLPRYSTVSQSEVTSTTCAYPIPPTPSASAKRKRFRPKKESVESSRERRAGRTLAIITGIFVVSWLPFFILAVIRPLCGNDCSIPKAVESVCLWLGYVNSAVNPVVYTIFSPDFRNAFKRTLRKFFLFGRQRHSSF